MIARGGRVFGSELKLSIAVGKGRKPDVSVYGPGARLPSRKRFDDQLEGIERSFDHTSILPLTDEQSTRLADAVAVRAALFPSGTGFLKAVYSQQWVRMSGVIKALDGKETTAAVKRLGLVAEADRLKQWVTLYGDKLGLTEAKESDPAAVAVEAWHEAYGELTVHVHSEYGSAKDEVESKIRETLVSPYQAQAEEERRAEQRARGKRKAGEPVVATTEKVEK